MNSRAEFIKLQAASFISQCGSHFLTLALSAVIFTQTGSLVKASLVFVLSSVPSVFCSSWLGNWIDRRISKKVLVGNELLAAIVSVICGLSYHRSTFIFGAALAIRSIFLFSSRTISAKWLKAISPAEAQGGRIKLSFLMFFLATGVSGLLASHVLSLGSIGLIIGIDVATYVSGAILSLSLEDVFQTSHREGGALVSAGLSNSLHAIYQSVELRECFFSVLLSQAIFLGAYTVFVNYLPIEYFAIGINGTGRFQLAASLGIIAGFLLVWIRHSRTNGEIRGILWSGGVLALFGAVFLPLSGSLLSFFVQNASYEAIWLDATAKFFQRSPAHRVAEFQFTLTAIAALCSGMATLAYAAAIQILGMEVIRYFALLSFVGISSWQLIARDRNIAGVGGLGR